MNPDPDDLNFESDDNDSILDPLNLEGGGPPGGIVSDDDDFNDLEQLQSDGDLDGGGTGLEDNASVEDRIFVGEAVPLDSMEDDPSASANPFDDLDAPASPPPSSAPTERGPAPENNTETGNQPTPAPDGAPSSETPPPPTGVDEPAPQRQEESQPYRAPRDAAGNVIV